MIDIADVCLFLPFYNVVQLLYHMHHVILQSVLQLKQIHRRDIQMSPQYTCHVELWCNTIILSFHPSLAVLVILKWSLYHKQWDGQVLGILQHSGSDP